MSPLAISVRLTALICVASAFGAPTIQTRFERFVEHIKAVGADGFIRPNVAPLLALERNAKTKSFLADRFPKEGMRLPEKSFDLLVADSNGTPIEKGNAVIVDAYTDEKQIFGYQYRIAHDGTLLAAIKTTVKRANGKPVRGSGIKEDLDIHSPDVQARFKKELDFWLSGTYRKYMKPKAAGDLLRS
jgi:hypothetical protein